MQIHSNYNLKELNTFGIDASTKFFVQVESEADLLELFQREEFKNNEKLFLGGGSNVLFTQDYDGIVIFNKLQGIEVFKEDEENVWIKSMAGEVWHDLVLFTVEKNYWGIENLASIPGTVGAGPMQNIGAYGVEIKDVLESLEAIDINTGEKRIFENKDCDFGYRDSVFKNALKGKYFILSVTLKLSKIEKKNTEYRVLKKYIEDHNIKINTSKDISTIVSAIRHSKLPDPSVMGNAGSFFKNVFVTKEKFQTLIKEYPDLAFFAEGDKIKIPTAWLIEKCGWKGKRVGDVGIHKDQALVVVNHGNATGQEIKEFAQSVIDSVYETFGIRLVPEVNLI